jgi:ABC-type branched-subunit amino acid transport system substrate-binding protein
VTKIAGFAYAIAPSSIKDIQQLKSTLAASGITMPYENLTLPLGTNDFTSYALAMKKDGVTGGDCPCVQSTNLAMIQAAKNAGITPFTSILATSADSTVFSDAQTTALLQGTIWPTYTVPLDINNPAATAFVANLKKYDSSYKGGYAPFGVTDSYLAGDIMAYGLKLAGPNPTRKSFISDMLKVSSYNDGGLLPYPIGWDHLGKLAPNSCAYFLKVVGTTYVDLNGGKPYCGTLLPAYKSTES